MLDAPLLLPDVGPAVVFAYAALENIVAECLDHHASSANLPAGLWPWLNDRSREPSTADQFDSLLRALSGNSLKDEPELWDAFVQLKDARNNFIHEGRAMIGKKNKLDVTAADAIELIVKTTRIVQWVEELLPPEKRRQKSQTQVTMQFSEPI